MLPDELLEQLNAQFPCRDLQTRQLAALYSPTLPSPPILVAHGLTATGKSSLIKRYLVLSGLGHAVVNSRECITGRHLLERTTVACLDALDTFDENGNKMDRRPYARTDSFSVLAVHLQKMLEGSGKFVLVFDGVDRQREAPATLLSALARFGEIIPDLSVILISTLPLAHALHKPGVPHLHFASYSRADLLAILLKEPPKIFLEPPSEDQFPDYTPDLAAEDDEWLWNRFLTAVWESLSRHTGRDLITFQNTSMRLWRQFVQPIVDGQFGTRDFSRLMVNRRHLFQIEDSVLDKIINPAAANAQVASSTTPGTAPTTPSKTALAKRKTIQHDLPYYTTHLLIAAYLASYNPSRTDTTYFMKHSDKRKNKRKVNPGSGITKSKYRRIPRHLLTPSPFPLERLFAIFRSLADGPVPQVADMYTQIATLTSMRLLVRVGGAAGADVLDPAAKWRVNFQWEWVRSLGRVVGVEVGEFLVGGVDG